MLCARCEIDTWWVSVEEALSDVGRRTMCGGGEGSGRGRRAHAVREVLCRESCRGWREDGRVQDGKKTRLKADRLVFLVQNDAAVTRFVANTQTRAHHSCSELPPLALTSF